MADACSVPTSLRPTRVEVDLAAVRSNARHFRNVVGPNVLVFGVVKADAYGHGAVAVARALASTCDKLAVSLCEEGFELRQAHLASPILVLGGYYGDVHASVIEANLTPVVSDPADLEKFADALGACPSHQGPVAVHLKVDTGMCRLGVSGKELAFAIKSLSKRRELHLEGLCTHLACADDPADTETQEQLRRFEDVTKQVRAAGLAPSILHAANSAAALRFGQAHLGAVRPGLALYGSCASASVPSKGLAPVLSLRSRLMKITEVPTGAGVSYGHQFVTTRPSRIAVLPIGYADGYPRHVQGAHVLVRGQRAMVAGVVCMDMMMVDVTDIPAAAVGDEATLIGTDADASISVEQVAAWAGTIPYEITCGISKRVPRRYRDSASLASVGEEPSR